MGDVVPGCACRNRQWSASNWPVRG